jgi:hypothetical protein
MKDPNTSCLLKLDTQFLRNIQAGEARAIQKVCQHCTNPSARLVQTVAGVFSD